MAVLIGVTGVEERPDANLILVQVDGSQLSLVQENVAVCVQLGKHPTNGVFATGHQALVKYCKEMVEMEWLKEADNKSEVLLHTHSQCGVMVRLLNPFQGDLHSNSTWP